MSHSRFSLPPRYPEVVAKLRDEGVDFIVIGGVAAILHGAARTTLDCDFVYARTDENLQHVVDAISPLHPTLRGAPPGLPFLWDAETLRRGLNFTLETDLGPIDLLGEVVGGGGYDDLLPHCTEVANDSGTPIRVLDLPMLIHVKRAAGRPKDFEAIAELEILLEMREATGNGERDS